MPTIADKLKALYNNMVVANNTTNEFTQALPQCYDAVEAKGGTIPAQETAANLPTAIASIPSGTPKLVRGTKFFCNSVNYAQSYGLSDIGFAEIAQYDWSEINSLDNMFNSQAFLTTLSAVRGTPAITQTSLNSVFKNCYRLQSGISQFFGSFTYTSAIIDMQNVFQSCQLNLLEADLTGVNISDSCTWSNCFNGCSKIVTIKIPSKVGSLNCSYLIRGCSKLENFYIGGIAATTNVQYIGFNECPLLTHDSLIRVLNALDEAQSAVTLNLGATNLAKLSNEEKAIATDKGWTLT